MTVDVCGRRSLRKMSRYRGQQYSDSEESDDFGSVSDDFSDDSDHAPLPRGSKKPNGKASQAQFSQEKLASVIDATERMGLTRGKGDEYAVCFSVRGPMLESPRASAHWPGHAAPSLPVSVQDVQ